MRASRFFCRPHTARARKRICRKRSETRWRNWRLHSFRTTRKGIGESEKSYCQGAPEERPQRGRSDHRRSRRGNRLVDGRRCRCPGYPGSDPGCRCCRGPAPHGFEPVAVCHEIRVPASNTAKLGAGASPPGCADSCAAGSHRKAPGKRRRRPEGHSITDADYGQHYDSSLHPSVLPLAIFGAYGPGKCMAKRHIENKARRAIFRWRCSFEKQHECFVQVCPRLFN